MANQNYPDPVTLAVNGSSAPIRLREGRWELELFATTWDVANPVTIQKAGANVESRFVTISDPHTANGPTIIVTTGGCFVRTNAPTIGTTTGLTLLAKFIGA